MSVNKAAGSTSARIQTRKQNEAQAPSRPEGKSEQSKGIRTKGWDVAASVVQDKAAPKTDSFRAASVSTGTQANRPSLGGLWGTSGAGTTATSGAQAQPRPFNLVTLAQQAGTGLTHPTARQGQENVGKAITGFAKDISQATDIRSNVYKLGEGDSYTIKVGTEGGVGVKGGAAREIEVSKEDGKYKVSVDSELTAGFDIGLNAKIPGFKAGPEGQIKAGVSNKVEYEFETEYGAATAAEILAKQARSDISRQAMGPVVGPLAQQVLKPSAEEQKLLQEKMSAIELKLSGTGSAAVEATLGESGIAAASTGMEGEVSTANTLRIELKNGKPSALVVKSEAEAKASGSLQVGLTLSGGGDKSKAEKTEGEKNSVGLSTGLSAETSIKVETETKVPLPSNFDPASLARDPGGTLKSLLSDTAKGVETKTTVTVDGSGVLVNSGGGAEFKLETTAKPADLARSGVIPAIARGDIPGALRSLGDKVEINATLTPYTKHGVSLSPEVELFGVGVGAEFEATRQDMAEEPAWEFKGTATDVGLKLNQFVQDDPARLMGASASALRPERLRPQFNPLYLGMTGF